MSFLSFKSVLSLITAFVTGLNFVCLAHADDIERPPIIGISSVELQISNIDESSKFYQDLLGFECVPEPDASTMLNVCLYHVNTRQTIIVRSGLQADQIDRLLSVSFETTDLDAMKIYLTQKLGSGRVGEIVDAGDRRVLALEDPEGHQVRFVQHSVATSALEHRENDKQLSHRLYHVGLTVTDAPLADAFYVDILGFSETWRGGVVPERTNWVSMRLPESTDYLEYMLVAGEQNRRQLGSNHHISLLVPDMQSTLDEVRRRAAPLGMEFRTPKIGRNNKWQLNLVDPDGTRVEIMEPFTVR